MPVFKVNTFHKHIFTYFNMVLFKIKVNYFGKKLYIEIKYSIHGYEVFCRVLADYIMLHEYRA